MLPDDTWEKANSGREKLHVSLTSSGKRKTTMVKKTKNEKNRKFLK